MQVGANGCCCAQEVPWAEDPNKLETMLADAQLEIGDSELVRLTDEQCKELCRIQPQFS
eukprot:COSAG05_NODE_11328_length_519_cov_0.661905_1_plen_59_part_00